MRVLVGWDDEKEAELIRLYLNVDGATAAICLDGASVASHAEAVPFAFDIVLLATVLPDHSAALAAFQAIRRHQPDCPIVGVARADDVYRLAPFLQGGLRASMPRDVGGDFVFLLRATLEATLEAVRSEADRRAAVMMRKELESVRQVQSAVLPQSVAGPPGYLLAARCEPSRIEVSGCDEVAIGGDYYDVVQPDSNHTTILLADATGHGLRACLSMIALDALLRVLPVPRFRDPVGVLMDLNQLFCRQRLNRFGGGFVTAICMVLRHDRHEIVWATAGHPVPLLGRDHRVEPLPKKAPSGPPLGVDEETVFTPETAAIPKRGRLLMYTDGLSEATSKQRQPMFGAKGLCESLSALSEQSPTDALERIFHAATRFAGERGLTDDATALLLERVD